MLKCLLIGYKYKSKLRCNKNKIYINLLNNDKNHWLINDLK